jgi:hypothetical protein
MTISKKRTFFEKFVRTKQLDTLKERRKKETKRNGCARSLAACTMEKNKEQRLYNTSYLVSSLCIVRWCSQQSFLYARSPPEKKTWRAMRAASVCVSV